MFIGIDVYKRYQVGMSLEYLYPYNNDRLCRCGCGRRLEGRRRVWFSDECQSRAVTRFWIIKGDNSVIRREVFKRDSGVCCVCDTFDDRWEADHILEVVNGGGCELDNFQTLCYRCHKYKTSSMYADKLTEE